MRLFRRRKRNAEAELQRVEPAATVRCDECGQIALIPVAEPVVSAPDAGFDGIAGYCPVGRHVLCWQHIEWLDASGGAGGRWVLGCKEHRVQVRSRRE